MQSSREASSEAQAPAIVRVGVALAAYEPRIEFFVRQLGSIQTQSFADFVCVATFDSPLPPVLDDPRMAPFRTDARFRFVENAGRLGVKKNFQRAIAGCLQQDVDAVACSDQDDVWHPTKLQRLVEELSTRPPLSLVHHDMRLLGSDPGRATATAVWEAERRTVEPVTLSSLLTRNVVTGASMMFDAELARRFPEIPDGARLHDHWYALLACAHGGVYALPEVLMDYRQHAGNVVGANEWRGLFVLPESLAWNELTALALRRWAKTRSTARELVRQGVELTRLQRLVFLSSTDFGLGLVLFGLASLPNDPTLTRAAMLRGFGKLLASVGASLPTEFPEE